MIVVLSSYLWAWGAYDCSMWSDASQEITVLQHKKRSGRRNGKTKKEVSHINI